MEVASAGLKRELEQSMLKVKREVGRNVCKKYTLIRFGHRIKIFLRK